jgi:two-component system response regulator PilR (NtrC family)
VTVLLTGETGTGKELAARALHQASERAHGPFVVFDAGAVPANLVERELFGHVRGAFTGADADRPGLVAEARGGTLFLDEIGELPPDLQPKLLRLLDRHEYRPVGARAAQTADIRVVAATNQDLARAVAEGRFREDLYYRINVIPIALPPLRERREDIPLLADHFLARYSEQMNKRLAGVSHDAMDLLVRYDWPGNVRELENAIERAVALELTPMILPDSLPPAMRAEGPRPGAAPDPMPEAGFDLEAHVQKIERGYIAEALRRAGGVQVKAAELVGMSFRSFRYYVKKYNLKDLK